MPKSARSSKSSKTRSVVRNSRATVSAPAVPGTRTDGDVLAEKMAATQETASAFSSNRTKASEYDPQALAPPSGVWVKPSDPIAGASAVSEHQESEKNEGNWDLVGNNIPVFSIQDAMKFPYVGEFPDGQPDPFLIVTTDADSAADELVAAVVQHRHFARETDPPRV